MRMVTLDRQTTFRSNVIFIVSSLHKTISTQGDADYYRNMVSEGVPLLLLCIIKLDLDLD